MSDDLRQISLSAARAAEHDVPAQLPAEAAAQPPTDLGSAEAYNYFEEFIGYHELGEAFTTGALRAYLGSYDVDIRNRGRFNRQFKMWLDRMVDERQAADDLVQVRQARSEEDGKTYYAVLPGPRREPKVLPSAKQPVAPSDDVSTRVRLPASAPPEQSPSENLRAIATDYISAQTEPVRASRLTAYLQAAGLTVELYGVRQLLNAMVGDGELYKHKRSNGVGYGLKPAEPSSTTFNNDPRQAGETNKSPRLHPRDKNIAEGILRLFLANNVDPAKWLSTRHVYNQLTAEAEGPALTESKVTTLFRQLAGLGILEHTKGKGRKFASAKTSFSARLASTQHKTPLKAALQADPEGFWQALIGGETFVVPE